MKKFLFILVLILLMVSQSVYAETEAAEDNSFVGSWKLGVYMQSFNGGSTWMVHAEGTFLGVPDLRITLKEDGSAVIRENQGTDAATQTEGYWTEGGYGVNIIPESGKIYYACTISGEEMTCLAGEDAGQPEKYIFSPQTEYTIVTNSDDNEGILLENNVAAVRPNEIQAKSKNDFVGYWDICYLSIPNAKSDKIYGMMILGGKIVVVNSEIISRLMVNTASIGSGSGIHLQITPSNFAYITSEAEDYWDSGHELKNGKLSVGKTTVVSMNDNGMLSMNVDGQIQYFCKANTGHPAAGDDSDAVGTITLEVGKNVVAVDEGVVIEVNAPGALSITLYRDGEPFMENPGDYLMTSSAYGYTGTFTFYASATYDGKSEKVYSDKVKVTVKQHLDDSDPIFQKHPAVNEINTKDITVDIPPVVHANEAFSITINAHKVIRNYMVSLYDKNQKALIDNETVTAGTLKISPLPAGPYRFTLSSVGDTSVNMEIDFTVSASEKTADSKRYTAGTDEVTEAKSNLAESNVLKAPIDDNILLSLSGNPVEVGETITVSVSAPGADGIRLYRNGEVKKESEGDSLEYEFFRVNLPSDSKEYYFAVASYNGVWSIARSKTLALRHVAASELRVAAPDVVHAGESFDLVIYQVKNAKNYDVKIYDSADKLIRQESLSSKTNPMEPLSEGTYTITVECMGDEAHTLSFPLEVSADAETGKKVTKSESTPSSSDQGTDTAAEPVKRDPAKEETAEALAALMTKALESADLLKQGMDYYEGKKVEQDQQKAFELFVKAAELGNMQALYNAGLMYNNGQGVEKDDAKAAECYQKAADAGHLDAQNRLAYSYLNGFGVEQDDDKAYFWYKKAADAGSALGMDNLGLLYDYGRGVEQDSEQAVSWYKKAAELGESDAMNNLGFSYENGRGVEQDYEKAAEWYRKAAEVGSYIAQSNLGTFYLYGMGVEQDYDQAMEWYQKSAENDYPPAQTNLGTIYQNGMGVEQDYEKAAEWYQKAVDGGDVLAYNRLGWLYHFGSGVEQNDEKAFTLFQTASETGDPMSLFNLAVMYENGLYVQQDYEKAFSLFQQASDAGYVQADGALALMYYNGEGVEKDIEKAFALNQKAAEAGDALGMNNLASMYEDGEGTGQDYEKAVYWYLKAADAGSLQSQDALGSLYHDGLGVDRDVEQAVSWWAKAAEQGVPGAQRNLGLAYANGEGVEKDLLQAALWLHKAAKQGDEEAASSIDSLFNSKQDPDASSEIQLTVSSHVAESGETISVTVSAPGADGIRLYRNGEVKKEAEGDSLTYEFFRVNMPAAPVETYYAEASYDGTWSPDKSGEETVIHIPAEFLQVGCPDVVRADEPFNLVIYQVENTEKYTVQILDSEDKPVWEKQLVSKTNQIDGLSEGMYQVSVVCVGNGSHRLSFPLEVSASAETGPVERKTEAK